MTDLEITRLCAEAMGGTVTHELPRGHKGPGWIRLDGKIFSPLTDDAQAMAMVKRFNLRLDKDRSLVEKWAVYSRRDYSDAVFNIDLNRAICWCIANMQKAKT